MHACVHVCVRAYVHACFVLPQEKNYILLDIPFQACDCKMDTGFEICVKQILGGRASPSLCVRFRLLVEVVDQR